MVPTCSNLRFIAPACERGFLRQPETNKQATFGWPAWRSSGHSNFAADDAGILEEIWSKIAMP